MGSANTFGTFLDTVRQLETGKRRDVGYGAFPEKDVFAIAKAIVRESGAPRDVKSILADSGLSQEAFLAAMVAGRDKGLFQVDDSAPVPTLDLTSLGRAIAG